MKLNNQQKQFLFNNCYLTAKTLDAAVEPGWQNYFIKCFDWNLVDIRESYSGQKYGTLRLVDKDDKDFTYEFKLIFQGNNYETLTNLGAKKVC